MKNKIKFLIKNPLYIFIFLNNKKILILPDKMYLKIRYKATFRRKLNLNNPCSFNEKLQWLKLNIRNDNDAAYVDKYEVKKIIAKLFGNEYVIPTLGIYTNAEEINFDTLPMQFVIKCTHDSGKLIIVKNKYQINYKNIKKQLKRDLKKNYYIYGREYPYKKIKPRIIIEKYMEDSKTKEIRDYKLLCFNGKVKLIEVHCGRYNGNHTQNLFYPNWQDSSIKQGPIFKDDIPKPYNLKKMIEFSEKIALFFLHVRVDWYEIDTKLYFGEITFFDASGFAKFDVYEDDIMIGKWLKLPLSEKNEK